MIPLPRTYLSIKEHYPAFIAAVESLGETTAQAGPLDDKTAQLIRLVAAALSWVEIDAAPAWISESE